MEEEKNMITSFDRSRENLNPNRYPPPIRRPPANPSSDPQRYLNELRKERQSLEPFRQILPHTHWLLTQEIIRLSRSIEMDQQKLESGSSVLTPYGQDPNCGSMGLEGRSPLPLAEAFASLQLAHQAPPSSSPPIRLPSFPLSSSSSTPLPIRLPSFSLSSSSSSTPPPIRLPSFLSPSSPTPPPIIRLPSFPPPRPPPATARAKGSSSSKTRTKKSIPNQSPRPPPPPAT